MKYNYWYLNINYYINKYVGISQFFLRTFPMTFFLLTHVLCMKFIKKTQVTCL